MGWRSVPSPRCWQHSVGDAISKATTMAPSPVVLKKVNTKWVQGIVVWFNVKNDLKLHQA